LGCALRATPMSAAGGRGGGPARRLPGSLPEGFENAGGWLGRLPLEAGRSPLTAVPGGERWLLDMLHQSDYDEFWRRVPLWQPLEHLDRYADVPGCYVGGWFDLYREEQFYAALAGRKRGPIRLLMGP